jgi:hypothetical protein
MGGFPTFAVHLRSPFRLVREEKPDGLLVVPPMTGIFLYMHLGYFFLF